MGCVTWLQVCKSPADKLMTSTGNSECKYLSQRWKFDQIIKYIAERIISHISSRLRVLEIISQPVLGISQLHEKLQKKCLTFYVSCVSAKYENVFDFYHSSTLDQNIFRLDRKQTIWFQNIIKSFLIWMVRQCGLI